MTTQVRVQCINKTHRTSSHERISHIGGINPDNTRWKLTESDAVQGIKDNRWAFYVEQPYGHRVQVIIAQRLGREYLKTEADGESPDNLPSLPECP
jgi:hypothetical protein